MAEDEARCEALLSVFGLVERCVLDAGHGYHLTRGGEEFTGGDTLAPEQARAVWNVLRTVVWGDPTLDAARRVIQRIAESDDVGERDD